MDKKIKYFILLILLIANLCYQCTYNFGLWNIFVSSLVIIILFYQFAILDLNKVYKFLHYIMIVVCFIEIYIGLKNDDWILTYGFFGFLLFLLWVCLEPTLNSLASFFLRQDHFSIALKFANISIFIFGKKSYILAIKGSALNMLNRYDEALVCLEESQELGYNHHFLYSNLGYCCIYLEDYEKALEYFKLASEINPNEFAYLYNISQLLIQLEKYDEALSYINKAFELNENNELLSELIEVINNKSD
ncbi:hypothetical protein TL18_00490 [Methanobrevibacter sp. YE315]|uniref:tetratricopeptide repeat protein n=1 Tax=Methanobrevibacter sp. YE315 TaxID=1609968 RepID=UPI000764E5D7|nr:tetratricopeptide repeat protein [Methanobrevibacter sp. YE315]AMD16647.1 hypothetical protein TL18_00490 [Methanobrevibacter sp. YE315]